MQAHIRPAERDDATAIAGLSSQFTDYLRALGDPTFSGITADQYLRDGFGSVPAFSGFLAEIDDEAVGYVLYCPGYDLDRGGRILHIVDLFVRQNDRLQGVGRALMDAASNACREMGGHQLFWAVYEPNTAAHAFYQRIGASYTGDLRFMYLKVDTSDASRDT